MLCADYPRLTDGTLVTQELLSDPLAASRDTLPNILARNGYSTTYLQAAGLRFMDKDRFMKLIGFKEIGGEEWFDHTPPVGNGAFIGCNVNLISPVEVGEQAYIAAGSTVVENVPGGSLHVARAKGRTLHGWVSRKGILDKNKK